MKRFALVVLALFSINAFASDGHDTHGDPNAPVDKKKETADFILHHVADDTEFEYEIPFPPYHLPAIHIADAFSFLKFETVPGACDGHATAAFASFPSLEKFIHGCYDLRPTKAILMMWTACAVLLALFLIGSKRDQNGVPRGTLSHSLEAIALFVRDEIATPNLGKAEAPRYTLSLIHI